MKKFLSFILIVFINIAVFASLIFVCDVFIYNYNYRNYNKLYKKLSFKYLKKTDYLIDINTYFDGSSDIYRGRKPDGLEYSKNKPIIIFGCSIVQGQFLNYDQTISYKLAHILKRPVYNRGIAGHGIQQMYWQTTFNNFYKSVPPADDVIFILIDDHYFRMHTYFMDILDHHFNIHYSKKHNDFILDNTNNSFLNILKSSYTFKFLNMKYADFYVNNPKNAEKITDEVLWFFIKTRENLEKKWHKKFKFTVIIFDKIKYKDLLVKKLKENNFNIIETSNITKENLKDKKYFSQNTFHPTKEVWDLLAPLIAKKIKEES